MDDLRQARILGLALVRGLLDAETLARAAERGGSDLLGHLVSLGVLDQTDVEVLDGIPPGDPMGGTPPGHPVPSAAAVAYPWQELEEADLLQDGRKVRETLRLPAWRNYRNLEFVAEGGLGRIFKAFDPALRRTVALKFLRRDERGLLERFILEAQHQALMEHPNICKVFEVGDWRGQVFIAMQFIDGETLESAAPRMTLYEKVEVMEIAAEAIHAAHRQGLIHRDIKPANLMVEQWEDTGLRPYILDFGLAKGLEHPGLTAQGAVMGTANYMAPEQVLGQSERIGRRTDVYALGATLYKILTGHLLFEGSSGIELGRRTLEEEPPPLHHWGQGIPRDLEIIVLRCLEKDPHRRYDSALALAEDLRRFREGEPIAAHPPNLAYRLGKFTLRHRLSVAASLLALLVMVELAFWGISLNLKARKVSEFAVAFGTEAEAMETSLRMATLLPRHDIRPSKAAVREQMARIRQEIRAEGSLAEGPGAYALGRGHLALGEFAEARGQLEQAWVRGYRTHLVAFSLGRALGELYRQGLEELSRIQDADQRETRRKQLQAELREPALAYLRAGTADNPERRLLQEGLLAYHEEDYPTAIAKARQAFREDPTVPEARLLEGKALVALGMSVRDRNPTWFRSLMEEAAQPFAAALDMARSDPALLCAEGSRRAELARFAYLRDSEPREEYAHIQAWLDQATAVDPGDVEVVVTKARLADAYAVYLGDRSGDPFPVLDEAIRWCRTWGRRGEAEYPLFMALGDLTLHKAELQMKLGQDPDTCLDEAFAAWKEALRIRPGEAWVHQRLAEAYAMRSKLAVQERIDPQPFLDQGLYHVKESLQLALVPSTAAGGADLYTCLGDWKLDHGQDPVPSFEQALHYLQLAVEKAPDRAEYHAQIAEVCGKHARYLMRAGGPVEEVLQRGLAAAQQSLDLAPTYRGLLSRADCLRLKAARGLALGLDPDFLLREATAAMGQARQMKPGGDYAFDMHRSLLFTLEGQVAAQRNQDPEPLWREGARLLDRSIRQNPRAVEPLVATARLAWIRGEWLHARGRSCAGPVTSGLDATVLGFGLDAQLPELKALRGGLLRLQALASPAGEVRERWMRTAQRDLETALDQDRFLEREFGPLLARIRTERGLGDPRGAGRG